MTETNGETIMSASELALLVREAVLEGATGKPHETNDVLPDTPLIVGPSVRSVIAKSVSDVVKDLVGRQILLSGPLAEIAAKAHEAYAEIEGLWTELRKAEAALAGEEEEEERPEPEPEPGRPVADETTKAPETQAVVPEIVAQAQVVVSEAAPVEVADVNTPDVARVESALVAANQSSQASVGVVSVEIPGWDSPIVLDEKTPGPLRSFFPEFIKTVLANGAIQPRTAMSLARKHGYTANANSLRDWLDNHLYTMRKFKDAEGDSWWGLPKQGEKPVKRDQR